MLKVWPCKRPGERPGGYRPLLVRPQLLPDSSDLQIDEGLEDLVTSDTSPETLPYDRNPTRAPSIPAASP